MPSNLPSSFASAAAGQNANRDARGRGDSRGGGGEWARGQGRANGTLTFRRTSTTPGQTNQSAMPSDSTPQTPVDHAVSHTPGIASEDVGLSQSAQYSKQTILELFRDVSQHDVAEVLEPSWNPGHVNGNSSRGWGKAAHTHANQDPQSCWLSEGTNNPAALRNLTTEEKEAFATDVNSPMKPPIQKEANQQPGTNGRKASVSHGSGPGYGLTSPTSASRPGTRRRETTDASPFGGGMSSPAGQTRFSREDNVFPFTRRGTDLKEQELSEEETTTPGPKDTPSRGGFGGLVRNNTSSGIQNSNISSLWGQSTSGAQQSPQSASGMGSFGQFAMPTSSTIGSGASRGGSRFANFIPKDNESQAAAGVSATTPGAKQMDGAANPDLNKSWRSRPRTDTDPFADDGPSGSAALGGAKDTSPPPMPNPAATSVAPFETPVKGSTGDFGMSGLNLGAHHDDEGEALSPSETNPYRSPPGADRGADEDGSGDKLQPQHGAPNASEQQQHHSNFSTLSRGFPGPHPFDGSDRSQTSSAGPKAYPSLSGLTGWPAPAPSGTPDRERQAFGGAFGNALFSPMAGGGGSEVHSPALGGLAGSVFGPHNPAAVSGTGSLGRSKLGSLFPPAMQAQMQGNEQQQQQQQQVQQQDNLNDSVPDLRQVNPLGAIGRGNFGPQGESSDSPMRAGRGAFEDLFAASAEHRGPNAFGSIGGDTGRPLGTPGGSQPQSFTPLAGSTTDAPMTQARTMVMPDRMRWVYLDPQGHTQGPFTGLEMNDWYKANFFTADLSVRKIEDREFEPLGQLIRRIGNSREPFLVPQIGVAHGPSGTVPGGPFSPNTPGGVVPPLSGVFPSYGRTLTAEEQNNLERRKQEEQFAAAQQREMVMRHQAMSRMPGAGVQGSLQHHSSAHSLQSQPSFGSIASPIGAPHHQQQSASGHIAPGTSFFDRPSGQSGSATQTATGNNLDSFREDELLGMSAAERQLLGNAAQPGDESFFPPQPIGAPGNEGKLRGNLPSSDQLAEDEEGFRQRLQQFEGYRAEHEAAQQQQQQHQQQQQREADIPRQSVEDFEDSRGEPHDSVTEDHEDDEQLSLTQQVQQAQAAAAQNAVTGLPASFPPPPRQTGTPLPAPTAQRVRSNLPEQYSRSQSGTPETATEPPPLAPWAKDSGPGGRKGPSLKEIQEAEARNAAKAEEAAAAARRATLEQEATLLREREKAVAVNPGLPTSSTWGNGSPVAAGSPWTKPAAAKAAPGASASVKQKSLMDIQREEEARKAKAQATQSPSTVPAPTGGKRYADFATRPGNPPGFQQPQPQQQQSPAAAAAAGGPPPPPGSGWATVGAGGKVRVPTGPASQQSPSRSASTSAPKPAAVAPKPVSRPSATSVVATTGKGDVAMEEFNKWLNGQLTRGITGVDVEVFAETLKILPMDVPTIRDAVYANSKTMNGQHFAEEFIRRKRRAEQGIVEKQPTPGGADAKASPSGGWSEVAKKSGPTAAAPSPVGGEQSGIPGFKVVPSRKKGGKK